MNEHNKNNLAFLALQVSCKKQLFNLSPHRRVTFCDQSESGYSTNNSGDESWVTGKVMKPSEAHTEKLRPDLGLDLNQNVTKQRNVDDTTPSSRFTCDTSQDIIMTPSPSSPLYYDPLHLRNLSKDPRIYSLTRRRSEDDEKSGDSFKQRGILKKSSLTRSTNSLLSSPESVLPGQFNLKLSRKHHESTSLPVYQTIQPNNGISPSISDPHHKSAFTPVVSHNKLTASTDDIAKISSNCFTPVKGPAVLDYVTSCEGIKDFKGNSESISNKTSSLLSSQPNDSILHQSDGKLYSGPTLVTQQTHQNSPPPDNPPTAAPRRIIGHMTKDMNLIQIKNTRGAESSASSRSGAESPISRAEVLANSSARLRYFLDNSSAKDLKKFLQEQLESKDPRVIAALSVVIPESVASQVESHCVRCHKNFNPHKRSRCLMPHPESMVFKIRQDEEGADFVCQCCSTAFRLLKMDFYEESTNAILTGHCYSGHHTTDPLSVDYRPEGGAAKSCSENGCVEFYV